MESQEETPATGSEGNPPVPTDKNPTDKNPTDKSPTDKNPTDKKKQKAAKFGYLRADTDWDPDANCYAAQDPSEHTDDGQAEEIVFHVCRRFDQEGAYKKTVVEIISEPLRACLQDVIGTDNKAATLIGDILSLDPDMLFLYLDDLRAHLTALKNPTTVDGQPRMPKAKRIETMEQLEVLVKYVEKDYASLEEDLYPMLEKGLITFGFLWALWKPNTLAFTPAIDQHEVPNVFKVEIAEKHRDPRGYSIEGQYLEYDGKHFGYGRIYTHLGYFKGTRKITTLSCYPFRYYEHANELRKELVARGKKFVSLAGAHYKSYQGAAFNREHAKRVVKFNTNGRIMVDAQSHRRIMPNPQVLFSLRNGPLEFSEEDYLIASPVVFGFSFAEKRWLEFTVSGVKEIQWDDDAYQSLVLDPKKKDLLRSLVESHKYHAADGIDDVIRGKGKGLVALLYGPPGTGKTLTAEAIGELLKCPIYRLSAGELLNSPRDVEERLERTFYTCRVWGALLLLDEADVFLEQRNTVDINRSALVTIFLQQLEYFHGILFLTTNRVTALDDAFHSRIDVGIHYDDLDQQARTAIFKTFIKRARAIGETDTMHFTEKDFATLAGHGNGNGRALNGRQIQKTIRAAQALAVNKREPLSMTHIQKALDVQMSFKDHLTGRTRDMMSSYI